MSVAGLMETPLICDIREEASTVLGKLIDHNRMHLILLGLTLSILLLATRSVAVPISTVGSGMAKERGTMTLVYGRALAAAVLSVLPAQCGLPNAELYPPMTLLVIVFTAIMTSLGAAESKKTAVPATGITE
jgi:NhaP-type Na+/H+ or K+/H+ antiporter